MANPNPLEKYVLKYPRVYGAILTAIGSGVVYWTIVSPLQQAESGASEIWISSKGVMLGEFLLLFGLPCLAFGSPFLRMFPLNHEQPKTPVFYITVVMMVIVGIVSYDFLKKALEVKGYIFH
jgi:hypothetical protein